MAALVKTVLILGGTGEARVLAGLLAEEKGLKIIVSFAGRTSAPELPPGERRTGGFGGTDGLSDYLQNEAIGLVADATHPFAATMSRNAADACRRAGIPYVRLERPAWAPTEVGDWREVDTAAQAAAALTSGAHAFVTVGSRDVAAFYDRTDTHILARMIEPPKTAPPPHVEILLARPPFTFEGELTLLKERGIDILVCKNSGSAATEAKLAAARDLGLLVIMMTRPKKPDAPAAATPEGLRKLVLELI